MADREANIEAAARMEISHVVTTADVRLLAEGLLEIAELAMPDSYFAEDSRCQLARMVLDVIEEG